MKRLRSIYIIIAIFLMASIIVVAIHTLLIDRDNNQENVESRLPYGDYLPDAENPLIRVVIKTSGFKQIVHPNVLISAEHGVSICDSEGGNKQETTAGEKLSLTPDHELFKDGAIRITAKKESDRIILHSLSRGYGTPSYRGVMELFSTAEGIVIVNELPVEEYLYAVVPSEMPASYHIEALKCQAICARSYAYCQMRVYGYPEYYAHVDDSVSYQVYGNCQENEKTNNVVDETMGMKLWYQGYVIKTYYYSTSCGHSTSVEAWGTQLTEENLYLKGVALCDEDGNAYERKLPWYRWRAEMSTHTLCNLIELNTGNEIGELKNISVTKQGVGGVAIEVTVTGTKKVITIHTENKIRAALGGEGYKIKKQDGTVVESTQLLPSAFFTVAKIGENYIIEGGGYGHGIGMSQNGANEMAKAGKTYERILQFFYPNTQVQ